MEKSTLKIPKALFLITAGLILFGIGCNSKVQPGNDGGLWKSVDAGKTWAQKIVLPTSEGVKSLTKVDAVVVTLDPTDNKTIYLGTLYNGMFASYDKGETWAQVLNAPKALIRDIKVDPNARCTVFVTDGQKVFKSTDCVRTFQEIFKIPEPDAELRVITLAPNNTERVFVGASNGILFESNDAGASWRLNNKFAARITAVVFGLKNNGLIYVSTDGSGLSRSVDDGEAWESLSKKMSESISGGTQNVTRGYDLIVDPKQDGLIYYATKIGIIKSVDDGETWDTLPILSAPGEARIYDIAINARDNKEIWYSATIGERPILYRTVDEGKNWDIIKVATARVPLGITFDPEGGTIYVGTYYKQPQQ